MRALPLEFKRLAFCVFLEFESFAFCVFLEFERLAFCVFLKFDRVAPLGFERWRADARVTYLIPEVRQCTLACIFV